MRQRFIPAAGIPVSYAEHIPMSKANTKKGA